MPAGRAAVRARHAAVQRSALRAARWARPAARRRGDAGEQRAHLGLAVAAVAAERADRVSLPDFAQRVTVLGSTRNIVATSAGVSRASASGIRVLMARVLSWRARPRPPTLHGARCRLSPVWPVRAILGLVTPFQAVSSLTRPPAAPSSGPSPGRSAAAAAPARPSASAASAAAMSRADSSWCSSASSSRWTRPP